MEFFTPNDSIVYKIDEIIDENNELIEVVRHPKQIVYLKVDFDLIENSMMRIKSQY